MPKKKLDEDADDGNDNKELDESMKEEFETESVKNLDIRTNDKSWQQQEEARKSYEKCGLILERIVTYYTIHD
ncbi:hypothetical protein KXD40_006104 [Peronospora effusa]|nr:hypothetical protein KXD40_006104 [Peronospora effusa]